MNSIEPMYARTASPAAAIEASAQMNHRSAIVSGRWCAVVAVALATVAVGCRTSAEDERFTLLARDREFSLVVKDINRVLSFYAPDATLCLPGMPVATGATNIRSTAIKFAAVPGFSIEWEPASVGVSDSRDFGFVSGTYRMTTASETRPAITGAYVEVWKKVSGDWKIAQHFFHPNPN
jgi:ketosteroid isomerase-like protein